MGKAGPGTLPTTGKGVLYAYFTLAPNHFPILSLLQWLRKPRSRHHIWEELCSLGLGISQQPRAW